MLAELAPRIDPAACPGFDHEIGLQVHVRTVTNHTSSCASREIPRISLAALKPVTGFETFQMGVSATLKCHVEPTAADQNCRLVCAHGFTALRTMVATNVINDTDYPHGEIGRLLLIVNCGQLCVSDRQTYAYHRRQGLCQIFRAALKP